MRRVLRDGVACLFLALLAVASPANAAEMRFERGALVSPATAEIFYGTSETHSSSFTGVSGFEGRPPEIVELARALNNDPDQIFEFVRNHIEVEFAFGLRKGALGALIDRSGTPFDQNVLFVELVREAGLTARYRIGRARLTAAQFEDWTGVSNILAACRMLAFGGIPAAFNSGASSLSNCTATATFTDVDILHVWSEVQIGGTWYVFDPSFKTHTFAPQRDLATESGVTPGAAASQAASGLTTGTQSGVSYIRDVNATNLNTYLAARSAELLDELEEEAFAADMREVIGGSEITPVYEADVGEFRASAPPYSVQGAPRTITGDIPDPYRTGFLFSFDSGIGDFSRQMWVDEIYGRRLEIDTNFDAEHIQTPDDYYDIEFRLELDDVALNTVTDDCPQTEFPAVAACGPPGETYIYTIEIDHPYADADGDYVDESVAGLGSVVPVAIVHGWGQVSSALGGNWGRERNADESLPNRVAGPYSCDPEWICLPQFQTPAGDMNRQRMGAAWLAQLSRMLEIQGEIGASEVQHQHTVGAVFWEYDITTFDANPGFDNHLDFGVTDQQLILSFSTALSVSSRTDDAARTRAVSRAIALSGATLEGSVVEQMQDLPDGASTASRFGWGNIPDNEDPCSGATRRRFYDFTGASSSTVPGLIRFEGVANGCSTTPLIEVTQRTETRDGYASALQAAIDAGYQVSGSEEAFLGPGARIGATSSPMWCSEEWGVCTANQYASSLQRGGAFVANRFDGNGDVLGVSHVVLMNMAPAAGGGGAQPERTATTFDPRRAADVLRDRFVDRSSALGVNVSNGMLSYSTPTLLSAGAGDGAPYRLDYGLSFQAGFSGCSPQFGPCSGPIQGGWNTSWDIRFSLSGSGLEAMGQTSPLVATDTIIAFMAMQDMFANGSLNNLRRDVYATLVADWWRGRMVGNVATVNQGFAARQFVRRADDAWQAPVGSPGTLTQTGARAKVRDQCDPGTGGFGLMPATARRWDATGVAFSLRNAAGDVMSFAPWTQTYSTDLCGKLYGFQITSWEWPQGPELTFTNGSFGAVGPIQSSLGRTLSAGATGASIGGVSAGFVAEPIFDPDDFIRDASNATWTIEYALPVSRSATERPRPYQQIHRVFEPVNPSEPALEYVYDALGRVREARDAVSLQEGGRDAYEFFIAERARGRRLDPDDGAFTVYYDTDGDAVRFIDEIGRLFSAEYDGRHRVVERTYPENDRDVFGYDSRDNVISLIRHPRPAASPPLDPIEIGATYDPTWNRIATLTDAREYRTDFSYHASGNGAGLLATAVRPGPDGPTPFGDAPRPTYTFAYNAIGLVTSETDPSGRQTTYTYDGLGNRTSATIGAAAIGGSALSLTTNFTPDSVGNVIRSTDPRGIVTEVSYDAMRRPLITLHRDGGISANVIAAERTTYDLLGRPTAQAGGTAFSGSTVTTWLTRESRTYTPTAQVATVKDGLNNTTTNTYDDLDRLETVTDPAGRVTRNSYDDAGQLLLIERAVGTALQQDYARYAYSDNGQRLSVRDANDNRSVYVYDGFDRPCRLYFPSATLGANAGNLGSGGVEGAIGCEDAVRTGEDYEGYVYDPNGNRTDLRRRSSETVAFTFDNLNRESFKDIPGSSSADVNTGYDLAGRRLFARFTTGDAISSDCTASNTGIDYCYDAAGRLIRETSYGREVSFAYDVSSNRSRITHDDGSFWDIDNDKLNRVTSIRENGVSSGAGVLIAYAYDPLSRRDSATRSSTNGAATDYTFDSASRLTALAHDFAGGATNDQTYGFSYTAASQLSLRSASNDAYTWPISAISRNYNRNGLNQYTTTTGTGATSFTHDQRGNLVSDGARRFCYDLENRLLRVDHASDANCSTPSLTLSYDPLGRLHEASDGSATRQFLYDGDALIAEYDGSSISRRFVHGPGVDEPVVQYEGADLNTRIHLFADRQGSIIAANGATTTTYRYGPYGETDNWSGSRFRYTGQIVLDPDLGTSAPVRLYHYKARVYGPVEGRFLQTDPVGYEDDLNLYAYSRSDPLNRIDPFGLESTLMCRSVAVAGQHCFVHVTNDDGSTRALFSYGPENNSVTDPGQLAETAGDPASSTRNDDIATIEGTIETTHRVNLNDHGFNDDSVVAAGQRVDRLVGTTRDPGPTRYDAIRSDEGRANSNAATARLLEEARPGSSSERQIRPDGYAPGWRRPNAVGTAAPPSRPPPPRTYDVCRVRPGAC